MFLLFLGEIKGIELALGKKLRVQHHHPTAFFATNTSLKGCLDDEVANWDGVTQLSIMVAKQNHYMGILCEPN